MLYTRRSEQFIPQRRVLKTHRVGPLGLNGFISLVLLVLIFSPLRIVAFIPQRRVPQNSPLLGPIGQNAFITLFYSPKESSLQERPWGSHCLGTLFLTLLAFGFSPPPTTHSKTPYLLGGWLVGWAYLPYGTLEHVRTIFLRFKCCKVSGIQENNFKIGLSTFEAIFELLGPKYT